jgi:hypothetical protein
MRVCSSTTSFSNCCLHFAELSAHRSLPGALSCVCELCCLIRPPLCLDLFPLARVAVGPVADDGIVCQKRLSGMPASVPMKNSNNHEAVEQLLLQIIEAQPKLATDAQPTVLNLLQLAQGAGVRGVGGVAPADLARSLGLQPALDPASTGSADQKASGAVGVSEEQGGSAGSKVKNPSNLLKRVLGIDRGSMAGNRSWYSELRALSPAAGSKDSSHAARVSLVDEVAASKWARGAGRARAAGGCRDSPVRLLDSEAPRVKKARLEGDGDGGTIHVQDVSGGVAAAQAGSKRNRPEGGGASTKHDLKMERGGTAMQEEPDRDCVAAADDDDCVYMGTSRSLSAACDQDRDRGVSSPSTPIAQQRLPPAQPAPEAVTQAAVDSDDEMTDAQAEWLLSNSVKNRHTSDLEYSKQ